VEEAELSAKALESFCDKVSRMTDWQDLITVLLGSEGKLSEPARPSNS
jgi:hypothetical protein